MTVADNIAYGRGGAATGRDAIACRVGELLDLIKPSQFADR